MGLPGLRGLEGTQGKGIPGEKVRFNQRGMFSKYYLLIFLKKKLQDF